MQIIAFFFIYTFFGKGGTIITVSLCMVLTAELILLLSVTQKNPVRTVEFRKLHKSDWDQLSQDNYVFIFYVINSALFIERGAIH